MIIGKPAPFVSAFIDAVDTAIRAHQHTTAMSATQRAWLAFLCDRRSRDQLHCWARFERASLGTYALAALSWMFRHQQDPLGPPPSWPVYASSCGTIGITSGSLVIDDTDNPRSKSATALAHLYKTAR